MVTTRHRTFPLLAFSALAVLILYSCASPGTPSGGPRDEQPPRFVRANPTPDATGVSTSRAVIEFDELVTVKDPATAVIVSPPQAQPPRVSANGRRVYVAFQDTLASNTTYTIDFGNSIQDVNEGNKLQGFSYAFSTGPQIDTLRISGMVLAARNLEPQQNMLVGVHPASAPDSAFTKLPFMRMARTDDRGRFTLRGLAPGEYRLFALADANNDYRWDNPQEDIAFTSFTVVPYTEQTLALDTIWDLKTGQVDSVVQRMRTRFLPNDVLLNSFNVDFKQQYLVRNERLDSARIQLIFNAPSLSLPELELVSPHGVTDWYLAERTAGNDTITLWITDKRLLATDTLRLAASYQATDKNLTLTTRHDTLRLIAPKVRPPKQDRNKDQDTVPRVEYLNYTISATGSHDVGRPVIIEFDRPLSHLDARAFRLEQKIDTVWKVVSGAVPRAADSISLRRFAIDVPPEYGASLRLSVDTLAATDIYGHVSRPQTKEFQIKKKEEYFDLRFRITSLPDSVPCFVELLNGQDNPVRTAPVVDAVATFTDVPLGTYYARLVEDENGNGIYDTGDYESGRQPEYVYYYNKALKMTKRWDLEQGWDLTAVALDMQKPAAIKKNKPEQGRRRTSKNKETNDEDDEVFDPTRNPFDPNDKGRRRGTAGSY